VANHYPVGLENQSLGAAADPGCGRPEGASAAGWTVATLAWLVAVPFVLIYLIYVSVGVMIEVLFGSPL
jgi:hypothetical protein